MFILIERPNRSYSDEGYRLVQLTDLSKFTDRQNNTTEWYFYNWSKKKDCFFWWLLRKVLYKDLMVHQPYYPFQSNRPT